MKGKAKGGNWPARETSGGTPMYTCITRNILLGVGNNERVSGHRNAFNTGQLSRAINMEFQNSRRLFGIG